MNRLEKLINDNRDEFDDMAPSEKAWERIEASLSKKTGERPVISLILTWGAAAAILVIMATITFFLLNKKNHSETAVIKKTDTVTAGPSAITPDDPPSEVNQFARLIAGKQEELKSMAKEQPVLYQKFTKDIILLDSSYNTLKNKLSVTPNREMLMEAMIQNLELQLNVLNQQLNIIRQIKKSKKYNHEKNKSIT